MSRYPFLSAGWTFERDVDLTHLGLQGRGSARIHIFPEKLRSVHLEVKGETDRVRRALTCAWRQYETIVGVQSKGVQCNSKHYINK